MINMDEIFGRKNLSVLLEAALDSIQKNKLKLMLDGGNFSFFFTFEDSVFGGDEGSRVMFAKMKDLDDEDNSPGWLKEAHFTAINLNKMGQGVQLQMIFGETDLPKVHIISRDEVLAQLSAFFEREKDQTTPQGK
jgi:hypothetical protein